MCFERLNRQYTKTMLIVLCQCASLQLVMHLSYWLVGRPNPSEPTSAESGAWCSRILCPQEEFYFIFAQRI